MVNNKEWYEGEKEIDCKVGWRDKHYNLEQVNRKSGMKVMKKKHKVYNRVCFFIFAQRMNKIVQMCQIMISYLLAIPLKRLFSPFFWSWSFMQLKMLTEWRSLQSVSFCSLNALFRNEILLVWNNWLFCLFVSKSYFLIFRD